MSQDSGKKGQKRGGASMALASAAAATPSSGAAPATPQTQSKRHKQREEPLLVEEPEVEDDGAVLDGGGEGDPATDNDEEATDDSNPTRNTTDQDGPPSSPAATEKVKIAKHSTAEVQRAPHCPYCCELLGTLVSEDRRSPPFGPCPHSACSLMMHMKFGGEVNLAIRQAKTEPKGKNNTTASVVAPVLDFSRREQELGKIALLGPVYPLYSDTTAVPDLDIDRILHGAFLSETHEIRPTGTLALIRSGKISMLSLITHRSTEDA